MKLAAVLLLLLLMNLSPGYAQKESGGKSGASAVKNYYTLKSWYTKWHEGLWGSRKYNEHELEDYLKSLKGKLITTPREFMLLVPESLEKPRVICSFKTCRWLKIKGTLNKKKLQPMLKENPELLTNWWRSRKLFAVSGRLKKFRLTRDASGDIIELWLYEIEPLP